MKNRSKLRSAVRAALSSRSSQLHDCTRACFEPLETRTLLTAVMLSGTSAAGAFSAVRNGSSVEFRVNGTLDQTVAEADVTSINIDGQAGNNTLTLDFSNGYFFTAVDFLSATGGHNSLALVGQSTANDNA